MMFFNYKYRYLFILLLALYTYINTELCQVYTYFQINIHWYYSFLIILLITFFTWEANRLLAKPFENLFPGNEKVIRRSIIFFFSGLVVSYLATIGTDLFFAEVVLHEKPESILNPLKLTLIYASLINLLFHLLNLVVVYQEKFKAKELEAEELKRMHAQAELMAIKQQINPHFLFNNLNVLSGLVMQQSADANNFIEAFSKVYMHILANHNKELIELKKELDFLEPYLFLLKQRFPESLQISVEVPNKYYNYYVVPVALQMLVENAIKHNVVSRKKPLSIKIYANGNSTLSVINNLQPRNETGPSSNIGLNNIQKRYILTAGKEITIEKKPDTFSVNLPLIEINTYESINN
ncbi:histidine kinase [Panacibacter sp. DH6]|uniref:Histidine kinase n=1 Tax=Panacibacter microcysteis TaxID=2793269 RepID=A0A931MCS7_9BACT|nr:histidine kinase [Panacibacter microcysteis]MBG9378245.1 histidine kinase [Panacibacter microcysteis]